MKTLYFRKSKEFLFGKCSIVLTSCISLLFSILIEQVSLATNQPVLFDFDNATLHSPLPISQTVSGITAHFSATGQGYSIQDNTAPVVPIGFTGRFIYPSSINLSDLLINFDQQLTDFSIMYSCQELACDDAATMRVTAYMKGSLVGTNTRMTSHPGTWPVDTLSCSFSQGFDSVVVHYDSKPPTCRDYGVVFLADNMWVTALNITAIPNLKKLSEVVVNPNPVSQATTISFSLIQSENINISIYDITGKLVKNLFDGPFKIGEHQINWDINNGKVQDGVYFLKLTSKSFSRSCKLVVVK
jgi:hypothetical protein